MIKQRIIIALFLFAKLLLLGHDLIPHDHHEIMSRSEPFTVNGNTANPIENKGQSSPDLPCCALDEIQIISSDPRSDLLVYGCTPDCIKNTHPHFLSHHSENQLQLIENLFQEFGFSAFQGKVSQPSNPSAGLRAPPVA